MQTNLTSVHANIYVRGAEAIHFKKFYKTGLRCIYGHWVVLRISDSTSSSEQYK